MQTSPFWGEQVRVSTGITSHSGELTQWRAACVCACVHVCVFYLINVGVPHLSEETERWWGVRVVNRELDPSLKMGQK